MSGPAARSGFAFQDLVLAERVLRHLLNKRAAAIAGTSVQPLRFAVEASLNAGVAPEWDLIESGGSECIVEEAKSGGINAVDRWAFWRRIRRTITHGGSQLANSRLVVRLVVNANNPPPNPEHWRALAAQSQRVKGTWFTPGKNDRRKRVSTAEDLADEALHVLTSPDADDSSTPLDLTSARKLLAQFSLNEAASAEAVEDDVRTHLAALSRDIGVDQLLNGLRGDISRRAESSDPGDHSFTSDDLLASFEVLERLARIEPATLRQWQALRISSRSNLNATGEDRSGGLPYQDWRTLHAGIAVALDAKPKQGLALLGRGGLGKSVLLQRWLCEAQGTGAECLLIAGTDLSGLTGADLGAALDLGIFATKQQRRALCIGVDAIENVVDQKLRSGLLAALQIAGNSGASVCVTSRSLEWRSARGTTQQASAWQAFELEEWPEVLVEQQIGASDRPNVGADLRRLLRTPLLLDLFLRTFGKSEQVPPGLQTRHGLLFAYWDRRILPRDDERSADRRSLILIVATDEAAGLHAHTLVGDAAQQLTSEGLFVLSGGGQRSFRHALLRDYAMGEWAHERTVSAKQIADKLAAITSPLLQFGSLRATVEKSPAGMGEILRELTGPLLSHAGTILGEFDDVSQVNFERLMDTLTDEAQAPFLAALAASVKLARNDQWLVLFSRLPPDRAWASGKPWLTGVAFQQIQSVIESFEQQIASEALLRCELASRLRSWSVAPLVRNKLSEGAGWLLGNLGRLLVQLDPSIPTAEWLREATTAGADARFWILGELPKLAQSLSPSSDGARLRRLYLAASGLREEQGMLRDDPASTPSPLANHDRITACLLGEGKGLLDTYPAVFVGVAAELLAGHEQEREDENGAWQRQLAAQPTEEVGVVDSALEALIEDFRPSERLVAAETRALQQAAAFEEVGLSADLFARDPSDAYWDVNDSEYYELIARLRDVIAEKLPSKDWLEKHWPGIRASNSARLRACVLDLLTATTPTCDAEILDELLLDERLYFVGYAQHYIQRGIRQRWPELSEQQRKTILHNIRYAAKPPGGNVWRAAPLFHAIPASARPTEAEVFLDLFAAAERSLEIPEPEADPFAVATPHRIEAPPRAPVGGLPPARQALWNRLADLAHHHISDCNDEEWAELLSLARELVTECLPSPEHLLGQTDLLQKLAWLADADQNRPDRPSSLPTDLRTSLASWSLTGLSSFPQLEVIADCDQLEGEFYGLPPKADFWIAMAHLADRLLWHPDLLSNSELNDRLFAAITSLGTALPDRIALNLLTRVTGWFRGDAVGRPILLAMLEVSRNGHVLGNGLRWLELLTQDEQKALLSHWFEEQLEPPMAHARPFVRKAGVNVGWAVARRMSSGETTGSDVFLHSVVKNRPPHGLLSDEAHYSLFVGQAVFGAKQALVSGRVPRQRAADFFALINSCWSTLQPRMSDEPSGEQAAVAPWILGPVLETDPTSPHALKTDDRLGWWRAASFLALTIVQEGPWREVDHLMGDLSETELLGVLQVADLKALLTALDERTKEASTLGHRYRWDQALSAAATVVGRLGTNAEATANDWLFELVSRWSAPPLSNEKAADVARQLRQAP